MGSQLLQNTEINIVVHWKFWRKYGTVSHIFSCSKLITYVSSYFKSKKWSNKQANNTDIRKTLRMKRFFFDSSRQNTFQEIFKCSWLNRASLNSLGGSTMKNNNCEVPSLNTQSCIRRPLCKAKSFEEATFFVIIFTYLRSIQVHTGP